MNNELRILNDKPTDIIIAQTKIRPQETLESKVNEQMQTFLCKPPINLFEEGKWLLAKTSFEATNSVFNKRIKTTVSKFQHQFHGLLKMVKKLLTN